MQQDSGHLEVQICELALWVLFGNDLTSNVGWKLNPPDGRREGFVATKPNPASTKCTGVAEPNVINKIFGNQFANMCKPASQFLDESACVEECFSRLAVPAKANKIRESAESLVQGHKERSGGWQNAGCML